MKIIEQSNTLSRYVGQFVRRQEDFKFITGHAQYVVVSVKSGQVLGQRVIIRRDE
jgi:hypothetical protein